MINGLKPGLKQVAPMMRPQMVVTTMWANFMIGLAYHLYNFTICLVYEAIGHVIATVETPSPEWLLFGIHTLCLF